MSIGHKRNKYPRRLSDSLSCIASAALGLCAAPPNASSSIGETSRAGCWSASIFCSCAGDSLDRDSSDMDFCSKGLLLDWVLSTSGSYNPDAQDFLLCTWSYISII